MCRRLVWAVLVTVLAGLPARAQTIDHAAATQCAFVAPVNAGFWLMGNGTERTSEQPDKVVCLKVLSSCHDPKTGCTLMRGWSMW